MRRVVDLLLIAAVLAAVGFGAYAIGTRVDSTSNDLAQHDSELNQTVYRPHHSSGPSRHTIELVAVAVGGAVAVMILVSAASSLVKTRRRQRWHAT
jgi:hypothetical protein